MKRGFAFVLALLVLFLISCSQPVSVSQKTAMEVQSKLVVNGWSIKKSVELTINGYALKYTKTYMDFLKEHDYEEMYAGSFEESKNLNSSYISYKDLLGRSVEVYQIDLNFPGEYRGYPITCYAQFWVDFDSGQVLTGGIYIGGGIFKTYPLDMKYSDIKAQLIQE